MGNRGDLALAVKRNPVWVRDGTRGGVVHEANVKIREDVSRNGPIFRFDECHRDVTEPSFPSCLLHGGVANASCGRMTQMAPATPGD